MNLELMSVLLAGVLTVLPLAGLARSRMAEQALYI